MMKRALFLISLGFFLAGGISRAASIDVKNPIYGPYSKDEVFLKLVAPLDTKNGYCLDIAGFPASGDVWQYKLSSSPLLVHTCKTGQPHQTVATLDQVISLDEFKNKNRIRFSRLNVCLRASTPNPAEMKDLAILFPGRSAQSPADRAKMNPIMDDDDMYLAPCSDDPTQKVTMDLQGRVHPVLNPALCLTAGEQSLYLGIYRRRILTLSTCSENATARQIWALPQPPAPIG